MLARTLGMTLADLRRRMTWREFRLWVALYARDPWGPERSDLMLAQVAAVIASCHTTGRGFTVADFLPKFGPRPEPVPRTGDDLLRLAIKANAMLGGKVKAN